MIDRTLLTLQDSVTIYIIITRQCEFFDGITLLLLHYIYFNRKNITICILDGICSIENVFFKDEIQGPGGSMRQVVGLPNNSFKLITNTAWVRARLCKITKKGALDSQPQVIKFTSCLPMVGGSLRVLRLLPPLKLVAMIQLKYC